MSKLPERAVLVVGGELEGLAAVLGAAEIHLARLDLEAEYGAAFGDWPDREALARLDVEAGELVRAGVAADSIGVVALGEAAPLAWLAGCTSRAFAAVASCGALPVYAALSAAKPMQPVEMTLNLDRPLLVSFDAQAAHLPLVREQLDAGSKDYEWLDADADLTAELARFFDERL